MNKYEILNSAIRMANTEYFRALDSQNLLQMAEMKRLLRKLKQLYDEI